jgi:hypothetical protein
VARCCGKTCGLGKEERKEERVGRQKEVVGGRARRKKRRMREL